MLELINVTKIYSSKKVLDGINLCFRDNGLYAIVGKSGSGKSTLLNILSGLIKPNEGKILINGQDYANLSENQRDELRRQYFGIVFQEGNLIDNLSVKDNLKLCLDKKDYFKIDEQLQKLNLKDIGDNLVNTLSGGEKQRVSLARAIIKNVHIILADEVTGNLDDNNGQKVMDMLKEISKDKLVILVTHNTKFAAAYADAIIELKDGKVVNQINNDYNQKNNISKTVFLKTPKGNLGFILKKHLSLPWFKNIRQMSLMVLSLAAYITILSFLFTLPINSYSKFLVQAHYKSLPITNDYGGYVDKNIYYSLSKSIRSKAKKFIMLDYSIGEKDQDESIFTDTIKNAIIIDNSNLLDREIIITDYIADSMVYFGFLNVTDSMQLIGKEIDIFDETFSIKQILKTDYLNQKDYIQDFDFYYSSIYINQSDYETFLDSLDAELKVAFFDYSSSKNIQSFIGNVFFLEDQGLIQNQAKISKKLYDEVIKSNKNYFSNNLINVTISKVYPEQDCGMILSFCGVNDSNDFDDQYIIFLSPQLYKSTKSHCVPGGIIFEQFNIDDIKLLYENGYYLYCEYFSTFANYKEVYMMLKIPFIILSVILLGVFMLLLTDLTRHKIKINNRDYFILKTLGFSKKRITSIIILEMLALILSTLIIGLGMFWLVKAILDAALQKVILNTFNLSVLIPILTLIPLIILCISVIILYANYNLKNLNISNLKSNS